MQHIVKIITLIAVSLLLSFASTASAQSTVTLTSSTGEITLTDGQTLTGTCGQTTHVIIADGATVTLSNVYITKIYRRTNTKWAGITCAGDATIILADGTINEVKAGYDGYPGIQVNENHTLTIQGGGSLLSKGYSGGAGIGGKGNNQSGNIVIKSGIISAEGSYGSAAIGGGHWGGCGDITIEDGVTYLSAKTWDAQWCIGGGSNNDEFSCGSVTVFGNTGEISGLEYLHYDESSAFTINFDKNGSDVRGQMDDVEFILYNEDFPLPACNFFRYGYFFMGWKLSADEYDGTVKFADQATVSNLPAITTLYAQWRKPNITNAKISGIPKQIRYTGSEIELNYTVTDAVDNKTLIRGEHFTTTITKDGETVSEIKEKGDYTITFNGMGGDGGSKKVSFSVSNTQLSLSGSSGNYYVKMPVKGYSTLSLSNTNITTFSVYDDGGNKGSGNIGDYVTPVDGNYSDNSDGYLTVIAPEGYNLQLSGRYRIVNPDYLTIYDNSEADGSVLYNGLYNQSWTDIESKTSSGRSLTFYFHSDNWQNAGGLDFVINLVEAVPHDIIVNSSDGGIVTASPISAPVNTNITLTVSSDNGYLLNDLSVTDGNNDAVSVSDMLWYTGLSTATFSMRGTDVIVAPSFTSNYTASGGLFINMPANGIKNAIIPENVQSFKVYDDGGISGNYSRDVSGSLVLTAPEGYVMQLSGYITTTNYDVAFSVYDNNSTSGTKLLDNVRSDFDGKTNAITTVTSTGRSMTLQFITPYGSTQYSGLDLTVRVFKSNTSYDVTINTSNNGRVSCEKTQYKPNETVSVTTSPSNGYVLNRMDVFDDGGNRVAVSGGIWFEEDNMTPSFKMPASAVEVNPTFSLPTAEDGLYVNMLYKGKLDINIPDGIQSFKVYDNGGENGAYSAYCKSTLVLTAPEHHKLQLSGSVATYFKTSYLTVYDNNEPEGQKLIENARSEVRSGEETSINTVESSGRSMVLVFYGNANFDNYAGLDLTVKLIDTRKSVEDLTITIPDQTYTGSAIVPEITVQDGETPLVKGTDYTVSFSNNINVGTSAEAIITGIDNYSGERKVSFSIVPKETTLGALTLTQDQNGIAATLNGNYTADATPVTTASDISVNSVTINRTFQSDVTSTIILPFGVESGKYSGGTFYEFTSVDYKNGKWEASMTKVTGKIEAHKPYLFKPSGDKLTITGSVTLEATSEEEYSVTKGYWSFNGVFKVKNWATGVKRDYFFASTAATSTEGNAVSAGDFVRIGNECGLSPFRCYLSYTGSESSLTKSDKQLPTSIEVRLIDEIASVVEPENPESPSDNGDIVTPVSEITPDNGVKVWSYNRTIYIESQPGTDYTVVDLSGRTLTKGVTRSTREEVTLSRATGIVIVKVNGKTFKIY